MFHSLLARKLVIPARAARRVAVLVSLFAVAALPYVNAGAWQQQKQVGGKKSDAVGKARINTRQSEKPAATAVTVKKTDAAQAFAVCAQSQPINFGQTVNGTLDNADCADPIRQNGARVDEYTFNGTAGQQVAISMSANFDTFLFLLRPDGSVLEENDDINPEGTGAPPDTNSRIPVSGFIILPFSGTYSILATSFAPETRGAYSLTLSAGATCSLTPIAYGDQRQGTLNASDCTNSIEGDGTFVDLYTFNGTAGQQISITMTAASPGNVDPFLYLLLPNGELLADDDNGGGGTAARIPLGADFGRLPVTGTYTIVANTFQQSQSGNYNLTLTRGPDCVSTAITLGGTVNGALAAGDCRLLEDSSFIDAYSFTGTAGQQIIISMTSNTGSLVPALFLLSPTGNVLATETSFGTGGTARIPATGSFTLPATGTYTVLANSFAPGQIGNYTLTLTENVQQNTHTISGQVRGAGFPLSDVTVSLSGGASATTTTDANGFYSFTGVPAGNTYTITPTNTAHYGFTPQTVTSLQADQTINFNGIPHIIISEFRFRGTAGATDEFVELYNQSDQTVDLTGWVLVSGDRILTAFDSSLPARSHYLLTGASYSLPTASDAALGVDIPDNAAVALYNHPTFRANNLRVDAVGFSTADQNQTEGGGLSPASGITTDSEHAFVRKLTSGTPQDTNNNSADFVLVATDPLVVGNNAVLGAPGAQNRMSPVQRNATIKSSLVDPQCSGFGALTSGCARVRTAAGANPTTAQHGTLRLRRKFTNTTTLSVTTLRFRVVAITTLGSPGAGSGQADLRVVSASPADFNVTLTDGSVVPVKGTQVETPPAQPGGGGLNSTLITATTATPIAAGDSVNVEFTLGVQQEGAFSFFVNVEALLAPPDALHATKAGATKAGATKRAGSRKEK